MQSNYATQHDVTVIKYKRKRGELFSLEQLHDEGVVCASTVLVEGLGVIYKRSST